MVTPRIFDEVVENEIKWFVHHTRHMVILYNQKGVDANKENGEKKKNEASKELKIMGGSIICLGLTIMM
jgi:hypothetical protein